MKKLFQILLVFLSLVYIISCEDEKYVSSPDAQLKFSADTIMFDTIFSTIGSTTQYLKVYNPYNQKILISKIRLAGGEKSKFRLNINGVMSNELDNIEIASQDSMYIFVEVTVDPSGQDAPMVVKDSIEFTTNANLQDIDLVAWGQDFNLIKTQIIKKSAHWTREKPYLVYNYMYVDSNATLTIDPGTKVYFHHEAGLYVKGKVLVNGTAANPVVFQGDRLEKVYSDVPEQWKGILLYSGSSGNEFNFAEIRNANVGLQVGTIEHEGSASATLNGTKIQNMSYAGIFAMKSEIKASNCLITNCGYYLAALTVGGSYEFYQSTLANYWWSSYSKTARTSASLVLSNVMEVSSDQTYVGDLNKAYFGNCIITGDVSTGTELELGRSTKAKFEYKFDHCILQMPSTFSVADTSHFVEVQRGVNPKFIDKDKYNFELDTLSPAKDAGDLRIGRLYPSDLKANSRILDNAPDLGAYERIEKKK